jgi:hypothetical protein
MSSAVVTKKLLWAGMMVSFCVGGKMDFLPASVPPFCFVVLSSISARHDAETTC